MLQHGSAISSGFEGNGICEAVYVTGFRLRKRPVVLAVAVEDLGIFKKPLCHCSIHWSVGLNV